MKAEIMYPLPKHTPLGEVTVVMEEREAAGVLTYLNFRKAKDGQLGMTAEKLRHRLAALDLRLYA